MFFNIDIAIVVGYILFCIIIGLLKYGTIKNIRDYTLGTKSFSTIVLLATTFATSISTEQIMGNAEKVNQDGLMFIIPIFFLPVSWFISAQVFAPNLHIFRKHNFTSLSDIMEYWYSKTGRWITNIIAMFLTITITATSAMAIGYLLHYFLNIPEMIGMIFGLIVVTSYSMFGGIASVAFTDLFQFLVFFIALPIACFIGYRDANNIKTIWSSLPATHTHIHDIPLLISTIFFSIIPNVDIPYIQRALIAKDKKQFIRSFVGVAILLVPMLAIVCLIGVLTYYKNPNMEAGKVLYFFIDHYLPAGIKGLTIAGLLAVIMSSQDSYLNTTSALFAHDICKQIWPSLTDKQELLIARFSCIFISAAAIYLASLKKGILETIWLALNFSIPLITVPLMAGLLRIRINKKYFIFVVMISTTTIVTTRFLTGIFDTRSMTVGMITSAIILYIFHKIYKRKAQYLYQKST